MVDEPAEIFDDMYLGLRAGAAGRKKRRGEPLSAEEQEALGRWQRLSTWRKSLAVGSFAVGTFGLGFTLGGLVFGRWRKPEAVAGEPSHFEVGVPDAARAKAFFGELFDWSFTSTTGDNAWSRLAGSAEAFTTGTRTEAWSSISASMPVAVRGEANR